MQYPILKVEDLFAILAKGGMNCIYKIRPCTTVQQLKLMLQCHHTSFKEIKINLLDQKLRGIERITSLQHAVVKIQKKIDKEHCKRLNNILTSVL